MFKKLFLLSLFFIILLNFNPTLAHVLHYQNLNRLEFDLYRNNELIGQHIYSFDRNGRNLTVHNKINFKIKVFGVTVYRYFSETTELYLYAVIPNIFISKSILFSTVKFCPSLLNQ